MYPLRLAVAGQELLNRGVRDARGLGRRIAERTGGEGRERQLIVRRDAHLDQLTDKLQEERVRVIGPVLSGGQGNLEWRLDVKPSCRYRRPYG